MNASQIGTAPDLARGLVVLCRVAARTDGDGLALPNDAGGEDARALVSYVLSLADGGAFAMPLDPRIVPILEAFAVASVAAHCSGASADDFERMLSLAFSRFLQDLRALSPLPSP